MFRKRLAITLQDVAVAINLVEQIVNRQLIGQLAPTSQPSLRACEWVIGPKLGCRAWQ